MSNKTPIKHDEKIESGPNQSQGAKSPIHLMIGAIMLLFGGWLLWGGIADLSDSREILVAPNGRLHIEIADTADERYKGLSGRDDVDGGLLFVYEQSSQEHCLVMRDMLFSIDMVWLDTEKKVLNVASNVSPQTYPEVFCPVSPAKYSLELKAGEAEKKGIKTGAQLVF